MNSFLFARSISSVLAAVVGIGPLATAVQILVPSQYTDLQAAIDAAPPGHVICIDGGVHGPVVIDKPLSLVGHLNNVPLLQCSQYPLEYPYGDALPAVTLEGPGTGAVTFAGLEFGGEVDNSIYSWQPPAIRGGGFEELWIVNCQVASSVSINSIDGRGQPAPAVDVTVEDLIVSDSFIKGGTPAFSSYDAVAPAGHGIVSTGDVSVYDSTVEGGDGLDNLSWWSYDYDPDLENSVNCDVFDSYFDPHPLWGQGGGAVSTSGTLYHAGSTFLAGTPAYVQTYSGAPVSCAFAPVQTVPALSVGATHTYNNAMLPALNMFADNQAVTIQWMKSGPGKDWLLVGLPATGPGNYYGVGEMYANPVAWSNSYVGTGLKSESFPGTNYGIYKGVPISFQVWSQAQGLSRPVIECWQPL